MNPFQIQSGVQAGPITTPQQHQGMMQGMQQFGQQMGQQKRFAGNSPAAQALQRNYAGNVNGNMSRNLNQFDRLATQANAQENLRSQQARAKSGMGWMKQSMDGWQNDLAMQAANKNLMLSLLGPYLG